jgi:hypothetical protein
MPYEQLVAAVEATTRFLWEYVKGERGYTTQDVRMGSTRLWDLCQQLKKADYPDGPAIQKVSLALGAAGDCLEQVRQRLEAA